MTDITERSQTVMFAVTLAFHMVEDGLQLADVQRRLKAKQLGLSDADIERVTSIGHDVFRLAYRVP